MRPCFTFKAQAPGKPAVLAIDDEIGFWGTQSKDFRASLNAVAANDLEVEINSPGGDVFAGLGMYNMLRTFAAQAGKTVTTRVTGVAASIASIIMLAGDKREMPKNAFAMVHSPMGGIFGATAEEMREHADVIDKIGASLKSVYVDRMGMDEATVTAMMAKDTWLTADECLENGFATDLTDAVVATAKFDMARAALPEKVLAVFKAQGPTPEEIGAQEEADRKAAEIEAKRLEDAATAAENPISEQIVARAKTLGLEAHAVTFALACTTMADADLRMTAAREISALCKIANRPDDIAAHIKANKPVDEVRAALIAAQADADTHTSNTKPQTNANSAAPGVVNPQAIWESHRKNQQQPKKGR